MSVGTTVYYNAIFLKVTETVCVRSTGKLEDDVYTQVGAYVIAKNQLQKNITGSKHH